MSSHTDQGTAANQTRRLGPHAVKPVAASARALAHDAALEDDHQRITVEIPQEHTETAKQSETPEHVVRAAPEREYHFDDVARTTVMQALHPRTDEVLWQIPAEENLRIREYARADGQTPQHPPADKDHIDAVK